MDKLSLDMFKGMVQKDLLRGKGNSKIRFLIEKHSPFEKFKSKILFENLHWHENYKEILLNQPRGGYTDLLEIDIDVIGELIFDELDSNRIQSVSFSETLKCRILLNLKENRADYELFDEKQLNLEAYISMIYKEKEKIGLKDVKEFLSVGDFIDVKRKPRDKPFPKKFNDFHVYYDLVRTVQDINFKISTLQVFKPYLRNLLDSKVEFGGGDLFRYFPTTYDKLYHMNAGLTFSLFYNFWDKIGDLLDNCFGVISPGRNVYFGTVIARFPVRYHASVHYKWLKDFKDNEFDKLLQRRNNIVHYTALESQIHQGYMNNLQDENEIEKLQDEIYSYVRFFQGQARLALEGLQQTVKLIDEIP